MMLTYGFESTYYKTDNKRSLNFVIIKREHSEKNQSKLIEEFCLHITVENKVSYANLPVNVHVTILKKNPSVNQHKENRDNLTHVTFIC